MSELDQIVRIRMRKTNLAKMHTEGIVVPSPVKLRLVPVSAAVGEEPVYDLEVVAFFGAESGTPDPVGLEQIDDETQEKGDVDR